MSSNTIRRSERLIANENTATTSVIKSNSPGDTCITSRFEIYMTATSEYMTKNDKKNSLFFLYYEKKKITLPCSK